MLDYVNVSIVGVITTPPTERGKDAFFKLKNVRGNFATEYSVIMKNMSAPLDVNFEDKVVITNAGQFMKDGIMYVVITDNSNIEVIRKRCNKGVKEV